MKRILFLIPALHHCGSATQLSLLATTLPRTRFDVRVATLAGDGPVALQLRNADVPVEILGWRRWIDIQPFLRLRRLVKQFQPDIVHAWCPASMRSLFVSGRRPGRLLVGSAQVPAGNPPNRLDAWLLRRADVLIANSQAEAEWYCCQGLPPEKVTVIPPGVRAEWPSASTDLRQSLGLPSDSRLLVCVGPLEQPKGFADAIWAFDILKFLYENLHLLLIGEGSHRSRLEQFARTVRGASHIHFVGRQPDVPAFLAQADVVWIPSRVPAGLNAALEATAMGRPVVASCLPALTEIVPDGVTGLLVPPRDKVALARATRQLLDDPVKSQMLGEAGRKRAASQFAVGKLVERFESLYARISQLSVIRGQASGISGWCIK